MSSHPFFNNKAGYFVYGIQVYPGKQDEDEENRFYFRLLIGIHVQGKDDEVEEAKGVEVVPSTVPLMTLIECAEVLEEHNMKTEG